MTKNTIKSLIILAMVISVLAWPEIWFEDHQWSLLSLVGLISIYHWLAKDDDKKEVKDDTKSNSN